MKNQFLLAALDLDGTLFNSQSSISDKNKKAIKAASDSGTIDLIDKLLVLPIHLDLFINGTAYTPDVCKKAIQSMNHLPKELKEYILSTRTLIPDITEYLRNKKQDVQKKIVKDLVKKSILSLYKVFYHFFIFNSYLK